MRSIYTPLILGFLLFPTTIFAQPSIDKIVKKVEAKLEPAEAKPGQLVTLKVMIELEDGWHTYPTEQIDKGAKSQVNKFVPPKEGVAIFVGKPIDPPNAKSKSEPDLGIEKMFYYPLGGTFEHKVVVSPKAIAGDTEIKFTLKLLVCDKNNCLPPEKFDLSAKIKILDGPAVEIDPKYKAEVEKLLQK